MSGGTVTLRESILRVGQSGAETGLAFIDARLPRHKMLPTDHHDSYWVYSIIPSFAVNYMGLSIINIARKAVKQWQMAVLGKLCVFLNFSCDIVVTYLCLTSTLCDLPHSTPVSTSPLPPPSPPVHLINLTAFHCLHPPLVERRIKEKLNIEVFSPDFL